jgi:hypothetical protein
MKLVIKKHYDKDIDEYLNCEDVQIELSMFDNKELLLETEKEMYIIPISAIKGIIL